MAENNNDSAINGVNGDSTSEFFDDTDFPPLKSPKTPATVDIDRLNTRIADLEAEKSESKSRIAELKSELEKLRVEKESELEKLRVEKNAESERSESNSKAAEAIAKRAAELEGEVARLQHDFISASNDASEANREIQKLNAEIAELKREKEAVEGKVKVMELKMEELVKKSDDSEKLISGFMQKIAEGEIEAEALTAAEENGGFSVGVRSGGDGGGDWKGLKEKLPVIGAVSAGLILVAGVICHVRYSRN
ncbi:hypothetical protein RND81_09G207400 [Saponaria officinalis]|uniref:Uncharacterized protein n=1 Tax=Saponaria officinalis TaxID=3572 RepID=A0AAW1IQJ3_SAPOF